MYLESASIDREAIKCGTLQDELVEWRNTCFESEYFCSPPDTSAFDFNTLWNVLKHKNASLSDDDN